MKEKVVFITGISTGFGLATAQLLAANGHKVYGTVRNLSEFIPSVNVLKMDLTDEVSVKEAVATVLGKEGKIDVLINNAGMHSGGAFESMPSETINLQLQTNINGPIMVLREVLPSMRNRKNGTIVNISSIGGLMGLPFQSFYSAGKFAVEGYSTALRMELKAFNIKVVLVNPGDFKTNNTRNRKKYMVFDETDPYFLQLQKTMEVVEKDETRGWAPEKLAKVLLEIVESSNPKHRYIVASFEQKLAVLLNKLLPSRLFYTILSSHYKI